MDLPCYISYRPLRLVIGVIVGFIVLVFSPILALIILSYQCLFEDIRTLGKTLLLYLFTWFFIMKRIWIAVFTNNLWFGECLPNNSPGE